MNASLPVISQYGNRIMEWELATLNAVLKQLRSEQERIADIDTARLITEAEQIKNATNYIHEKEIEAT
jgi:hypothetical protein